MTSTDIIKANRWPADYTDTIDRVFQPIDCHGSVETRRNLADVLAARRLQFTAGQARRAVAGVEQGA